MAMSQNQKAAAARAKMAKRAKRARFIKENKKRITLIILGFLAIAALCVFTPMGPNYVRMMIDEGKMATPDTVATGTIKDLYNLGVFYQYSFRKKEALECYNEIGRLYYGFKLAEYPRNREASIEKRYKAQLAIKKGTGNGPPFTIDNSDLPFVALAVWRAGELLPGSKNHVFYLYNDLYLDEFVRSGNTYLLDEKVTSLVDNWVKRHKGAR